MQPMFGPIATLAVTAIFYIWRNYAQLTLTRESLLHRRVAYMLWVMATQDAALTEQREDKECQLDPDVTAGR